MRRRSIKAGLLLLFTAVAPLPAQSLFSMRGLGLPSAPVGARARALGGIGAGLIGFDMSWGNPATIAGLGRRGIVASLQPGQATPEIEGSKGSISAARFPLIRMVYPVSARLVTSLGYGALLEQSWGIQLSGQEIIGGDTIDTEDVIEATGAVARVGLGVAYQVSPSLAVGLTAGIHTGNLDRRVSRTFGDTATTLRRFDTRLQWNYSGTFGTVGMRYDMADILRAGASITLNRDLEIEGQGGDARDDRVDMPIQLIAGASGALSSTLVLATGLEWSGGASGRVFNAADAKALRRNTWHVGGGLEYQGWGSGTRTYPIRLGINWAQLPYYDEGESPASEWAAAVGIGFRLAGDLAGPLAVADVTVERGSRSGFESAALPGGLTESFWRWTFSLSLFGL